MAIRIPDALGLLPPGKGEVTSEGRPLWVRRGVGSWGARGEQEL